MTFHELNVMGETPRNSVLLTDTVKNYRSVDLLPSKQSLLMLSSSRKAKAGVIRAGVARDWVAKSQVARNEAYPLF